MASKNFLYGLGLGFLGYNLYPLIKGKCRTMAIKMIEGAIETGSTAKFFVQDVNEKAMEYRQEFFRKKAEDIDSRLLSNNDKILENIESLKKQITELKSKIEGI